LRVVRPGEALAEPGPLLRRIGTRIAATLDGGRR